MHSPEPNQFTNDVPRESLRRFLPAVVAAIAALALYAVTLGGTYVYDDVRLRPDESRYHDEDPRFTHPHLWPKFWTEQYTPGAADQLYRPLTCMTFAVEFAVHGDRPWLCHIVNWLLHAGAAAAVAELARRLFGFRIAMGAGLLFAVHPVHVEAVAGLVGRAELLCTLATLMAAILFLKPMTARRAMAIAICFVVAVLSKEQGFLLPGILLALVPFRSRLLTSHLTSDNVKSERGAMRGLMAAICLIAAGYLVLREETVGLTWDRGRLDWADNPMVRSVGADRFFMPLVLLGRYLRLLVFPSKLSLDYGAHVIGWAVNWGQMDVYLGMAVTLTWLIVIVMAICRRNWAILFCMLGLLLSYGLVSNAIILIGTIFGERLMYLPSAFFIMAVTALLSRLMKPGLFATVMALMVAAGSLRAFTYAQLWNNPLKLYLADLETCPSSMHLHGLVVNEYLMQGNTLAAKRVAEDCVTQVPDNWHSYEMCVNVDLAVHDFTHAETILASAHPYPRDAGIEIARLAAIVRAAEKQSP